MVAYIMLYYTQIDGYVDSEDGDSFEGEGLGEEALALLTSELVFVGKLI
jgi:hypothetical protein